MKRWAILVAGLYLVTLVALTMPVLIAAFYPSMPIRDLVAAYFSWVYWALLVVMILGQAAMLLIPVAASRERPIARRSVIWPVLASGLMVGLMVVGAITSVLEFIAQDNVFDKSMTGYYWLGVPIIFAIWGVWTVVFYRMNRSVAAMDVVTQQCRYLLKGSILELLVAVPTHIVARYRDYCCAGIMTFIGIVFGLSVMLFSFGPGVFLLFVQRWKTLHPGERG
jgi:hypothetical protein